MSLAELTLRLFFQIALILIACRAVGKLAKLAGQPQVVAEMVAGVLLGPSLLGLISPEGYHLIFPADSMKVLFPLAQLGLAIYMFIVGLEFRTDIVRQRFPSAVAVSLSGLVTPFVMGAALAWWLFAQTDLFPAKTSLGQAAAFLGVSMAITAFPVLARIIQSKNLTGTVVGTVALSAGALGDAVAWCLLALILASLEGDAWQAWKSVVGGLAYVAAVYWIVRPALARWGRAAEKRGEVNESELIGVMILLMLGSLATDTMGLHAVFGAFVMGAAMPRGVMVDSLLAKLQPLTQALLLPLFFAYSGLNTQFGLLSSASLWLIALIILAVAILSKAVACAAAARATGVSPREAVGVGILMNARGLMELVIINIGLERGIISPALFTALVFMAVVTTLMTSPLFDWLAATRPSMHTR